MLNNHALKAESGREAKAASERFEDIKTKQQSSLTSKPQPQLQQPQQPDQQEPQAQNEPQEPRVTREYVEQLIEQGKQEGWQVSRRNCDECIGYKCEGFVYYNCIKGADLCNRYVQVGPRKGSCGVVCIRDFDCQGSQTCVNYRCANQPACGDGYCNGNEDCSSCSQDCGRCPNDLSGFPLFMMQNMVSVIGQQAPASDTIAAANIIITIRRACQPPVDCNRLTFDMIVDNQFMMSQNSNVLILGTIENGACLNTALPRYGGIDCANAGLNPGQGLIKLLPNGSKFILVVAGDQQGVRAASSVLENYQSRHLSGTEYRT